jgi:protein SCO1/2
MGADGHPLDLAELVGQRVLLLFGYASCPDVCPLGLANAAAALALLGEAGADISLVFVTVDPTRDSDVLLADHMRRFHPRFRALRLEGVELGLLLTDWAVRVERGAPNAQGWYSVDHTAHFYLIDRQGRLARTLPHNASPAELQAAMEAL